MKPPSCPRSSRRVRVSRRRDPPRPLRFRRESAARRHVACEGAAEPRVSDSELRACSRYTTRWSSVTHWHPEPGNCRRCAACGAPRAGVALFGVRRFCVSRLDDRWRPTPIRSQEKRESSAYAVGAVDDPVADLGEALGSLGPGQRLGQSLGGRRIELPGRQAAEERPLSGDAFRTPLRASRPQPGVARPSAVTAELQVLVGGGAFLPAEPPPHPGQIGQGPRAELPFVQRGVDHGPAIPETRGFRRRYESGPRPAGGSLGPARPHRRIQCDRGTGSDDHGHCNHRRGWPRRPPR